MAQEGKRNLHWSQGQNPFEGWPLPQFELRNEIRSAYFSQSEECLTSGPAGTGKSLAWLLYLYHICRKYAGARCLIVRKTRESLTESILVTWERDVLGSTHPILTTRPNLRKVRQAYQFPNGSHIVVGGMDKPDKVLSSEWDIIYAPEATEFEIVDWETLGGRLRSGVVPFQRLIADCNPTTPHHWLYQRCLNGFTKLHPTTHKDNPRYWDREKQEWTPAGKQYLARLERMTGTRRKRFLEGVWEAAEGLVYDFSPALITDLPPGHVLPNDWVCPKEWKSLWSIDWGLSSPTSLSVWRIDPERRMYHSRHIYKPKQRADTLGKYVRERWLEPGVEPWPMAVICDVSPRRGAEKDALDAKALFEAASGLSLQIADKADREKGIRLTQARFDKQADDLPRIFFKKNALDHERDQTLLNEGLPTDAISEISGYMWDEKMINDEPIDYNDHFCDEMRYAVTYVENNGPDPGFVGPTTTVHQQMMQRRR
jgi:PBSX family phage terminase large subunit